MKMHYFLRVRSDCWASSEQVDEESFSSPHDNFFPHHLFPILDQLFNKHQLLLHPKMKFQNSGLLCKRMAALRTLAHSTGKLSSIPPIPKTCLEGYSSVRESTLEKRILDSDGAFPCFIGSAKSI